MIAVREDPRRTEMLGYDIRKIQFGVFTLAGGLAALSGVLYASWNNIMTPTTVNATAATLPIIWVATAGRKSLLATIVTTFGLQWLTQYLALTGEQYALLVLGGLILGVVLFFPEGILQPLVSLFRWRLPRR